MKKMIMWIFAIMLLTVHVAFSEALVLPQAGGDVDVALLEQQSVFSYDAKSGDWSARAYQTDAAIDWFWEDGSRTDGPVLITVELQGSEESGLIMPVLRIYHMIENEQKPVHAVSILVDGVRHDFTVTSAYAKVGTKAAEVLSALLDNESLKMLDAMAGSDEVSVRLLGDGVVTTKISSKSTAMKARIEYTGLTALKQTKTLLQNAGMYAYNLWDLNAAAWETMTGNEPMYQNAVVNKVIGNVETPDAFGMLRAGTQGNVAAAAQKLLREAGFMAGGDEKNVNDRVTAAVLRAQKHYGLLPTGCMDGTLAALLAGGEIPAAEAGVEEHGVQLGGVVEIALERYWIADCVKAQYAQKAERVVSNSDRCLLVVDGMMTNLSAEMIRTMIDAKAVLVMNGQVRYDALIVVECGNGTQLDTQLLAQEQARVIVYAEIPQTAQNNPDAQWTMEVTSGGETIVFTLK